MQSQFYQPKHQGEREYEDKPYKVFDLKNKEEKGEVDGVRIQQRVIKYKSVNRKNKSYIYEANCHPQTQTTASLKKNK